MGAGSNPRSPFFVRSAVSYAELQSRIAAELSRTDLTSQIQSEIASAIEWYQYEDFPWTEASTAAFNTVKGQRYYSLPANFLRITDALSQIGNYTYKLHAVTEQYLDRLDWGDVFWTSYPILYSIWANQIRVFPPPPAGLPVQIKGIITQLTLMAATKGAWAANTVYASGDTVTDSSGNVEQATTSGTSGASAPSWPVATTPGTGIGSASIQPVAGQTTTDNTVTWKLVGTTANVWTTQAEELIRSRVLKNLYARYLRDVEQAQVMERLETQALQNMQYKNAARVALGRVRAVL